MNLCDEIPISPLLRATRHRRRRNFSQVQCLIEKTDVHPAPLFSFSVNDGEFNTPKEAFDSIYSSFYKGLFHFIPSKGGVHNIKCRVINSAYREIHQEVMKTITVRGMSIAVVLQNKFSSSTYCILSFRFLLAFQYRERNKSKGDSVNSFVMNRTFNEKPLKSITFYANNSEI